MLRLIFIGKFIPEYENNWIENGLGHAAAWTGSVLPLAFAANRICAIRDGGIPIFRQLYTVETGASSAAARAVGPPNASMISIASWFMR